MNEEEIYRLYYEAREELAKYRHVVGVGLGLKERRGTVTDDVAFRVYVEEKKDPGDLEADERIPPDYRGVPTDVLKVREATLTYAHEDQVKHSPLIGGITISNTKRGPGGYGTGTLGFFATINGVSGYDNVVLITNRHVLASNGGVVGGDVMQPNLNDTLPNNTIGTIHKLPQIDDFSYQYPPALRVTPNEPASPFWIDCASAKLNICVSSLCHTNCGVSFANEIMGLAIGGLNKLLGVGRAQINDTVFKVGRRTGRTQGRVVDIASVVSGGGLTANGILEVEFVSATEPDVSKFSDEGDSGAAIVNAAGLLVGLHYSVAATANRSLQSHIHPVLAALDVTPITQATPVDNPAAVQTSADLMTVVDPGADLVGALRERFLSSPRGRAIAALVETHRHEVVHLVNHNRRVTLAWHRSKGPAFLNRAIANARDPGVPIPREIEGVSRDAWLTSMSGALSEHGSASLRATIREHGHDVVAGILRFDSLHDLVDDIARTRSA
jgi:hypothetical protein